MLAMRRASRNDLADILAIERESFEDYLQYKPNEMEYLLFEANSESWVAELSIESKKEIAGYYIILFRKNAKVARLYSIAVAGKWRGKGIGKIMLSHAESRAVAQGCNRMHLEVKTTNADAIALYTKNGYTWVDFLPDYYKEGVHGIRLEKKLDPGSKERKEMSP